MALTPEEVANKQFTSTRLGRGYDEGEVDDFLDEVEVELRRLYQENEHLREQLAEAQRAEGDGKAAVSQQGQPSAQGRAQSVEEAAGGAAQILAMAQKTANEHIGQARAQAERLIAEARARAEQLKRDAETQHRQQLGSLEAQRSDLEQRIEELRAFEREYRTRLKNYLETQLHDLTAAGSDQGGGDGAPGAAGATGRSGPFTATNPS